MKIDSWEPTIIEPKWQKIWEGKKIFSPDLGLSQKPFFNLMMFPYPSAEGLHVGNMYAFTGSDIYGRFKRMQGFDVFEPIGLDGFGIHSENYALKVGRHPKEQAAISEKNFYRQLRAIGNAYDWSRTVETYSPNYYKWTQWIFVQMFKNGLAVRKKSPVNFCPSCKTVLADEQVVDARLTSPAGEATGGQGKCERCSSIVEKKELEQWFFKITDYADRLLEGLARIDWAEKIKIAQRNWIGKSEGVLIQFSILNSQFSIGVFTTRPDTLFGATFLVLSPEHPIIEELSSLTRRGLARLIEVKRYVKQAQKESIEERIAERKEKTGVFTGLYAVNPVNKEKIPIWVADYVAMDYGTGAIMGVPAHDQRDFEFAKKYNLLARKVITKPSPAGVLGNHLRGINEAYEEEGIIINSGDWDGWRMPQEMGKVIRWLEKESLGKREVNYHLRDWLVSRQRYWGPPIPIIYCEKCGTIPVPEKDLPVELPFIEDYKPLGTGESPLATHEEFYRVACPRCRGAARRETDVSDTFLDSAWYFFRYISTEFNDRPFDKLRIKKWLPVDMYIGGAEHSVLHLLYTRFLTMVFKDMGLVSFEEPFKRFYAHGLLISEGAKMSKSRGNVVIPDDYIKKYGADTLRCYLMFLGPFNHGGGFRDTGIEGMYRFLKRVWKLIVSTVYRPQTTAVDRRPLTVDLRMMHKTIKKITEDMESLRYNTAIATLMEWYNEISKRKTQISKLEIKVFLKLLAPFAPYMTEELWSSFAKALEDKQFNVKNSVHSQPWPKYDPRLLEEDEVTIVVQVNGKLRDTIKNSKFEIRNSKLVKEKAKASEKVKKYLEGRKIKKVVYVPGKIINFVVEN